MMALNDFSWNVTLRQSEEAKDAEDMANLAFMFASEANGGC